MKPNLKIDYVVLNAGVLKYPNVSLDTHRTIWLYMQPH